jgi:uridine kinase
MNAQTPHTERSLSPCLQAAVIVLQTKLAAHPERPILVALDGRCGSGKSTLAAQLAALFPTCNIFHTDDFYLPVEQRISDWATHPAANMDFTRLRNEVLLPARAGQEVTLRAWSCPQKCYLPAQQVTAQPLVLIEGSYSLHPQLADLYDCKIFLTCSSDVQRTRLQNREGEHFSAFAARWIPLEEGYFSEHSIEAEAELILDTGEHPLDI